MASRRGFILLLAAYNLFAITGAGPIPNVTSLENGLITDTCSAGDVVYMRGDDVPGSSPCESCVCGAAGVQCSKQTCEPRPGCKALHRPDHCCPTYQCECEQEGRVYSNGEKLVDPADPCRVCYCQGGEVVCRRIACFVRDDCRPRLVPGRCCPEYDDCPLRGVTAIPGIAPVISSASTPENAEISVAPLAPKENIRQEITIKEITPVSEIPSITEVKIKEILPSPSIDVAEYPSSKSPLIPREVTSEINQTPVNELKKEPEYPVITEIHSTASSNIVTFINTESKMKDTQVNNTNDSRPSKISLSTQDSINSDIYPSNIPSLATMGPATPNTASASVVSMTTKAPIFEEEDTSLFDHNPAFPPIPDDLSVMSNHEDEILSEQILDNESTSSAHDGNVVKISSSTSGPVIIEVLTTTSKYNIEDIPTMTTKQPEKSVIGLRTTDKDLKIITESPTSLKGSPMLNLRSAIPTDILNIPSFVHEEITGELDDTTETAVTLSHKNGNEKLQGNTLEPQTPTTLVITTELPVTTPETTPKEVEKTNLPTEVTSRTELSSFPIETSDQNPHETSDIAVKDKPTTASDTVTPEMPTTESILSTTNRGTTTEKNVVIPSTTIKMNNNKVENVETTEFIMSSFGSSESATETFELVKIPGNMETNAAFIEQTPGNSNNVLKDLINLVVDVASISDHTEGSVKLTTVNSEISASEELIPVNFGYKSKNNNRNVNSITEMPIKSKGQGTKQKIIEIEDEDTDNITDSLPPNDKMEPTTKRPIIDNVSNDMAGNKTDKKDIEIITQSYVPTINKRPTKVVMKNPDEKPIAGETTTDDVLVSASNEEFTERVTQTSEAYTVFPKLGVTVEDPYKISTAQVKETTTVAPQ